MEFSKEPENKNEYTLRYDDQYSRYARLYDIAVKIMPGWKTWIKSVIPHIKGNKVLEVSFGPGYLLTKYADKYDVSGIDYNEKMVQTACQNLRKKGLHANLLKADIEKIPFDSSSFDTIICTMAFSGYTDAEKALSEMLRVMKNNGKILVVDINFPANGNWIGTKLTQFWQKAGDIIRDMNSLFKKFNLDFSDNEIGGFGSVHLYIITHKKIVY